MSVTFRDITEDTLAHLAAPDPVAAYREWVNRADPDVQSGLAALGWFAMPEDCARSLAPVAKHRDEIERFVRGDTWRQAVDEGIRAASAPLGGRIPDVRLYVLVGPGRSDASASIWNGRGLGFIWLESWLGQGSSGELQDRDPALLPAAVSHELAHAVRAALPGTSAALARHRFNDPREIWDVRISSPLREVMYEEGLAVRFALAAHPAATLRDQLSLPDDALDWLDEHSPELLVDRQGRWDLDAPHPPLAALRDAIFYEPERARPPWSIARPPTKWGYYVGAKRAEAAAGDWLSRLASPAPNRGPVV